MAESKSFKDLKLIYNKGIEEEGRDARRPDDAKDVIPITHAPNTIKQKDYAMPLSQIGVSTVGTCATEADEQIKEVSVIRGSFPFNTEKADEAIGREILVKFTNKNTADSPKIKIGNMEAMPIVCIGGTSIVGEGCWEAGATMKFTFDGENWLMHSNVASKTKSYTILADGTTIYTKPQTDSAINGALADYERLSGGTEILANIDLNSVTNIGSYYCRQNTTVATLLNCPTSTGFRLQNKAGNTGNYYLIQELTDIDGNIYKRTKKNTTWGTWVKLATESDITVGNNVTNIQTLATSGEIYSITIPEDGYYYLCAINTDVSGACGGYITKNNASQYIQASDSGQGTYKRATTGVIPFKKGTVIEVRAFFTNSANFYRLS